MNKNVMRMQLCSSTYCDSKDAISHVVFGFIRVE